MIDAILHIVGLCGESHVSIAIISPDMLSIIWNKISQLNRDLYLILNETNSRTKIKTIPGE